MYDVGILLRVIVLETEVFQLCLDIIETQTVGKWGVDIERLASYLVLLDGRL